MSKRSLKWLAVGVGVLVVAVAAVVVVRRALGNEEDQYPELPEPAAEPKEAVAATR